MITKKGSVVLCSKHRVRSLQVCTVLLALLDLTGGLGTPLAELLSVIQDRETSGRRGDRLVDVQSTVRGARVGDGRLLTGPSDLLLLLMSQLQSVPSLEVLEAVDGPWAV